MNGFLDPSAPNPIAEYTRYVDGDLLGKLIARNLLVNRLGYSPASIFTPLGRYGDAAPKYAKTGHINHDLGDGHIQEEQRRLTFEIKCARINIANRARGDTSENWAFTNLLRSPGNSEKQYDILIAIGISVLGLEDHRYWAHLKARHNLLLQKGLPSRLDALPHEAEFLSLCSFFIAHRRQLPTNYFRINLSSVTNSPYAKFYAKGYDDERCKEIWTNALAHTNAG
ncbi:MAG: hypothetical protein ABTQ25_12070 [Nitrosomonas ureae]|jgi:hypothetical protein